MCDLDKGPETRVEEEDDDYWVAYCRTCKVLMVWSKEHTMPVDSHSRAVYKSMTDALIVIANRVYGEGKYNLDFNQRQILDHMHIHGRPK